jgi:hypothetical protein
MSTTTDTSPATPRNEWPHLGTTTRGPVTRTFHRAAPTFTLRRDDVDDAYPQEWVLRSGTGHTAEVLHRWAEPMSHAHAQQAATTALHQEKIRVSSWASGSHQDEFVAVVGSTFNDWFVLEYRGRGGIIWTRNADGTFLGRGGARYTEQSLARTQGPLTPTRVHNLPALVDELNIYRMVAGYLVAPEGCLDLQCEEYFDEEGESTGIEYCSHVHADIATAGESAAYARVVTLLETLFDNTPETDTEVRNVLDLIKSAAQITMEDE